MLLNHLKLLYIIYIKMYPQHEHKHDYFGGFNSFLWCRPYIHQTVNKIHINGLLGLKKKMYKGWSLSFPRKLKWLRIAAMSS